MIIKELVKCETLEINQLNQICQTYGYHLVYYFDKLAYGKCLQNLDLDNINEGFLFDQTSCVHIYRDGGLKAVKVTYTSDKNNKNYVDQVQLGSGTTNVAKLHIRNVLSYDIDGQAYYAYTLPLKIEFKDEKEGGK